MLPLYDHPEYYEIAFSFRDIGREVTLLEQCIDRYSRVQVTRILELACGPSPHLEEICRRGYEYVGLDVSPAMLAASRRKADRHGLSAMFVQASMLDFHLDEPVEFAFVTLGSLYVTSDDELERHLASVAMALVPGGLYLLDWCVQFGRPETMTGRGESWEIRRDDVLVKTTVRSCWIDERSRLLEEEVALDVNHAGRRVRLVSGNRKLAIGPQEFLELIAAHPAFEFVGWWNNWDLDSPLRVGDTDVQRPIALLRRAKD